MQSKVLLDRYHYDPEGEKFKGGHASVFKGADFKNNYAHVAIKILHSPDNKLINTGLDREFDLLMRLDHENIIKVIDGGRDPDSHSKFLVLEWADECLLDRLENFTYQTWGQYLKEIGKPVLEALRYALQREVIHRDLKPANILFDSEGRVKVADFGIGKYLQSPQYGVTLADFGSPPYVDLHLKLAHFCMSELTLPDAARSNTVKQLDRRNRGNFECKYMLFLVQISMQMHSAQSYCGAPLRSEH